MAGPDYFRLADYLGVIHARGAIWERMFLWQTNCFLYQPRREYLIKGTGRQLDVNVKAAFLGL
jgi:hypothetical protein